MNWNCTRTEERLSDFLDGTLTPEESAAISAHAASCADCTRLIAQVRGVVNMMQQAPPLELPAQLERKILDATLGPQKPEAESQGWLGWLSVLWQPRFAMGIVTVAASFVIVFHAATAPGSNLNPVNLLRGANRQAHLTYARGAKMVNNLRVVYEIESRMSPPPESLSEPITPPVTRPTMQPQPGNQQPGGEPREKSQTVPHTQRNGRNAPELAQLVSRRDFFHSNLPDGSSYPATRSIL
jgi:Putative zinc-finger